MAVTISVITVSYNAKSTIARCMDSVFGQDYPNLEYIVIDGASTDGTLEIIQQNKHRINRLVSEPDKGLYHAINKGISLASGDVVGLIHADDLLAHDRVISQIAREFEHKATDAVYGDLEFFNAEGRLVRKWKAGNFSRADFEKGWMPPHPTVYLKRKFFLEYGLYDEQYGSAADYELILRMFFRQAVRAVYIPEVLVRMQTGGVSNRSVRNRLKASYADYRALKFHKVKQPLRAVLRKIIRKISQFRLLLLFCCVW